MSRRKKKKTKTNTEAHPIFSAIVYKPKVKKEKKKRSASAPPCQAHRRTPTAGPVYTRGKRLEADKCYKPQAGFTNPPVHGKC